MLGVTGNNANSLAYVSDGNDSYYTDLASNFTFLANDSTDPDDDPNNHFHNPTHIQDDYVDLSYSVGGSVWDLNQMGTVGTGYSTIFTEAFVKAIELDIARKVEISLIPTSAGAPVQVLDPTYNTTSMAFDVEFTGDGATHQFDLQFVRTWNNDILLGSVPVAIQTKYFYDTDAIDADDDALTYSLIAGSEYGATIDNETGKIHWVPTATGDYDFTVVVTDGRGGQDEQSWTVTVTDVSSGNTAPTLASSGPHTLTANREFSFRLQGSDVDGDVLLYQIVDDPLTYPLPAGFSIDGVNGIATWTPTNAQVGTHEVLARVLDGRGGVATQVITLVVEPVDGFENNPPIITSTPPEDLTEEMPVARVGEIYSYQMEAYDPEGDNIGFDISYAPDGVAIHHTSGLVLWRPTEDQLGDHQVILRVRDDLGGVTLQSFSIRVLETSGVPQITSTPGTTFDKQSNGGEYIYNVALLDPDGVLNDVLDLELINTDSGVSIPATATLDANGEATVELSYTPSTNGFHPIHIRVTDQDGKVVNQIFNLQVYDSSLSNNPPEIDTNASTNRDVVQAGALFVSQIVASDPDFDAISFSLLSGPTGMAIDADTGIITWQTEPADINDPASPYTYQIRVTDARGAYTDSSVLNLDVTLTMPNTAPEITTTTVPTFVLLNDVYSVDLEATDAENDLLAWILEQSPTGMTIDSVTGEITWVPVAGQEGEYTITAVVMDPYGGRDEISFNLITRGVNSPPVITSVPATETRQNDPYRYQVTAYDPEGETLTYSLVSPPTGMTINSSTGQLDWTPDTVNTYTITVQITDASGMGTEQVYDLDVVSSSTIVKPIFLYNGPKSEAWNGIAYPYDALTNWEQLGSPNVVYTLNTAPTGMSINSTTGVISWTPNETPNTDHLVVIGASDGDPNTADEATLTYYVHVSGNSTPVLNAIPNVTVDAGNMISRYIAYYDADGEAVTWTLDTAPSGMVINEQGVLSWLTTPSDVSATPYDVTVRVTDPHGSYDTESFQVTVQADTTDPVVNVSYSPENPFQGDQVVIHVTAIDNTVVEDLVLEIDGTEVLLDGNNEYILTVTDITNGHDITVTATDISGNDTVYTDNIAVLDPNNTSLPTATLATISGDKIQTLTDIVGTVDDTTSPSTVDWTLTLISMSTGTVRELGSGTGAVSSSTLGSLDPTRIANGSYVIKLSATNSGGLTSTDSLQVTVDSDMNKVGNFNISFLDLELTMSQLPISVTRSYDTLRADEPGDFGYGWVMDLTNTKLEIDYGIDNPLPYQPFTDGTKVTVTLPDGETHTFTFQPTNESYVLGVPMGAWLPTFTTNQLFTGLDLYGGGGPFLKMNTGAQTLYLDPETGNAYNPKRPEFGNALTMRTREGMEYTFDATTGKLFEIRDTHGNTLTITDYGIFHSAGRSIQFVRNQIGFITEIIDPANQSIYYTYDQDGNLTSVTDREGNTTQFIYHDTPLPEHYLKGIISPNGATAVENVYDSNGLLTEVLDADENSVEVDYIDRASFTTLEQAQLPTAVRKEILTDQLGEYWTTYYDDRGNKIAELDPLGGMMLWEYSDTVTIFQPYVNNEIQRTYEGLNLLVKTTKMIGALDSLVTTPTTDAPDLVTTYHYWIHDDNMFDPPNIPDLAESVTAMVVTTTDPRGNSSKRYMNRFGRVIQEIDARGNSVKYNYQEKLDWQDYQTGNLYGVHDQHGQYMEMKYDSRGNVTNVRDSLKNSSFLQYNSFSELVLVTDTFGNVTTYEYDAYGQQTGTESTWINPEDAETAVVLEASKTYDLNGRVTGTTDELGNTASVTYNNLGQVVTQTDQHGRTMTYRYDQRGLVVQTIYDDGTTSESVYDVKGREVYFASAHRPGEPTRGVQSIYNERDQVTTTNQITGIVITVTANGNVYESSVTSAGAVLDSYSSAYDDVSGQLQSSTDSYGNTTSYEYDEYGQQIEVEKVMGSTTLTTTYEYDSYGQMIKMTDPYDRDTYYVYDEYGRQIKTIHYTNAESTTTYDDYGRVVSQKSYTGVVTTYEYDAYGRQSAMETTTDGVTNRTEYEYDNYGQRSLVRDSYGHETLYRYDAYGRQVSYTQVIGEIDDTINMETDDLTYLTTYDVHDNVLTETNSLGLTRTFTYDSEGRLESVTLPQVADPQNGGTLTAPVYEYDYDVYGNLIQITDPLGRETGFTFNEQNQQLTRALPVTGTEYSWYDEENRKYRSEDFEGKVLDRLFTDEGLLDELQYFNPSADPDVDTPDETVSYSYDDQYRKTSMTDDQGTTYYTYDDDGRITQIDSPVGILNYEYDDLTGRRTRVTTGNPSDVENDFRYTYDSLNRLKTVEVYERNDSVLSTPEVTTYSYDAVGNLVRTDLANGVITAYEYDELYRLDVLTHYEPDSTPNILSDNDKLAEYDYTVRADGKRTGVTETRWDNGTPLVDTFSWTYDDLGRLVTEVFDSHDNALDFEANYTYDLVGNRLEKTVDQDLDSDIDEIYTYTYNTSDQLLTESKVVGNVDDGVNLETDDTTTTYSYTGTLQTGKEVKETYSNTVLTDTTFDYNLQGRMETVTIDTYTSGSISKREVTVYDYDDTGIRVSAHHTVDEGNDSTLEVNETTTYLNDPLNHTGYSQVIEEVTEDNLTMSESERVVYTLGLDLIQQVKYDSVNPAGLSNALLYDGHGSVRMLTDMLGALAVYNSIPQNFTYDAYGIAIGFNEVNAATSYLYSGEQFDNRIQQQYLRARYYSAVTGGFNRLDPFFGDLYDPQILHKYLYTHGDPVNGIDPSGLFSLTETLVGMGVTRNIAEAMSTGATYTGRQIARATLETGLEILIGNSLSVLTGYDFAPSRADIARSFLTNVTVNLTTSWLGCKSRMREFLDFGMRTISDVVFGGQSLLPTIAMNLIVLSGSKVLEKYGVKIFGESIKKYACFVAGTPVLAYEPELSDSLQSGNSTQDSYQGPTPVKAHTLIHKPIDKIHLGSRVAAQNPNKTSEPVAHPDETWRHVVLEYIDDSGSPMRMELLREASWLAAHGLNDVGNTALWTIEEISLHGAVRLLEINPCPKISEGEGHIVTGTFNRLITEGICSLHIAGVEEPLVGTGSHLVWSETASDFIPMQDLVPGDVVRTHSGFNIVQKVTCSDDVTRVYNIEVNGEHCFFAGQGNVLVHNADYGYLSDNTPRTGPIAEVGEELARWSKSLYASALKAAPGITPLMVEMVDGTRKIFLNGRASNYAKDKIEQVAPKMGIDPENVIRGRGGEHAEAAMVASGIQPSQVKAVGIGQEPCGPDLPNCRDFLLRNGWVNVYWETGRIPNLIP
ncbi:MAG: putative Ig domain-containing protein [Planctomycetaceae bacterium]